MTNDELMREVSMAASSHLRKVLEELIARSNLQTAAIVAMEGPEPANMHAKVAALTAHVAPKKKYTVEDIVIEPHGAWHTIRCGDRWISQNRPKLWGTYGDAFVFSSRHAEIVAAGLRATNNLPEEYK